MKKMSTLFEIIYTEKGKKGEITNNIREENKWVYDENANVVATRKFDGAATAIINGELYKRLDCKLKNGKYKKPIPFGAIECSPADIITGHHPHWTKCQRNKPEDKYFYEAFDCLENKIDGTYELCGEKVQKNPEKIKGHKLIKHGSETLNLPNFDFETIKTYLSSSIIDIEGIVFYSEEGQMCKIRKADFGVKR